jgi:hypothetical protein
VHGSARWEYSKIKNQISKFKFKTLTSKSVWSANIGVHFEFLVLGLIKVKCCEMSLTGSVRALSPLEHLPNFGNTVH